MANINIVHSETPTISPGLDVSGTVSAIAVSAISVSAVAITATTTVTAGGSSINAGATDPGMITVATATTWEQYVRLTLSGAERMTLTGTARVVIVNAAEPDRAGDIAYDCAVLGSPSEPRISFKVQDGWQLPVYERLSLTSAVRCTLVGRARLMPMDFGQNRSRMVLQASSASR